MALRLRSSHKTMNPAKHFIHTIARLDTHQRLLIALIVAAPAYGVVPTNFNVSARLTIVWVTYALTTLALTWTTILLAHPRELPQLSRLEDSSRTLILVFVVVAAVASLFAVVALLGDVNQSNRAEAVTLAVLAVVGAWGVIHTVFTLRYAHLYYGDDPHQTRRPGGLDFPHDSEPDYLDFAYFSFVIGMTSQVSDVTIGSKPMRRTALVHGLLSFGFNAVIIALTISGLSGVLS